VAVEGVHSVSDAHATLRETFAGEVAARLPRLEALRDGDQSVVEDARRDAHTLGSSAIIVSEPEIARLAHAVELELAAGPVAELISALRGYAP
jgi:HPt (histidine-containing phosphotransfer) domain-containing protein